MTSLSLFAERVARPFLLSWGLRRSLLATTLGAAAAVSMPPYGAFPLLFLCFPCLIWLLDGATASSEGDKRRNARRFFSIGWAFGFGFFLVGLLWIGEAFLVEAETYAWMMPFAVVILPAGLALFPSVLLSLASLFWRQGSSRILVFAVAFTLCDYVRAHVFTGFPWNSWGYAVVQSDQLVQLAAYIGLFGLSFLVLFVAASPALLLKESNTGSRKPVLLLAGVLAIAALVLGTLRWTDRSQAFVEPNILIVQPNVPQSEKWKPENRDKLLPHYLEMTAAALKGEKNDSTRLIFWPESAFPFLLTQEPGALAMIAEVLPQNTYLITGGIRADYGAQGATNFYNSVYLVDANGIVVDVYDKVRLVPFGEYLPFREILQSIGVERLVPAPSDFTAGYRYRSISISNDLSFQPLVCYEAIFPQSRLNMSERPQFLANITNDGWFGDSSGPYQHLMQARMRAVEQGIPVIRAANTGVSAVISPHGEILSEVVLNRAGSIKAALPKILEPTLYGRWGDWISLVFILGCVCLLLVFGVLLHARRD
ncbi:apolipoprotein N-acyltransferase [Pseudovibrio sp. SPO723]|uniref:apolipoprotein N-acyltransferase n=1 Tax=Nesiotobacter zosterae TaxID=392721 RepID=UPI0029C1AF23|nr:apolipoprotein N-acyltransferase [Pseudovibrio sp. SPO723]MDX5592020.1 apolipoprotein N-acyltransferase [Pseudovibrio sp. SPO723]